MCPIAFYFIFLFALREPYFYIFEAILKTMPLVLKQTKYLSKIWCTEEPPESSCLTLLFNYRPYTVFIMKIILKFSILPSISV